MSTAREIVLLARLLRQRRRAAQIVFLFSLAISNLALAQNGPVVRVLVSDSGGSTTSAVATLTVTPISGISFDFNTPGQYTNAPYNLIGNDWMNSALINNQPFGPVVPFEVSTGGVGVATG